MAEMNAEEIERRLQENLGRKVKVRTVEGRSAILAVLNVDQEGCVCRVIDDPDYVPGQEFWCSFDELAEVEPASELQAGP